MDSLTFNEIIKKSKEDTGFALNYLKQIFNYYNDNLKVPIKCSNPLAAIKCFIPLPTRLLLSDIYTENHKIIKISDSEYQFHGKQGSRLVFSDKILPFISKNKIPIPFSYPVYDDDHVDIILSNVYYWEVTLGSKTAGINSWNGECVSIGFGHKNTNFESHVGWYNSSVGFHSDDGTIRLNCTNQDAKPITKTWESGDIAGAGIIYLGENKIKPFFTFNGKLIKIFEEPIIMSGPYFPMIGYDHSHSIKINFSNSKFKFNIKKLINEYSKTIISTENIFISDYDIGKYLNEQPYISKTHPSNNFFSKLNTIQNLIVDGNLIITGTSQLSDFSNLYLSPSSAFLFNNLNNLSQNLINHTSLSSILSLPSTNLIIYPDNVTNNGMITIPDTSISSVPTLNLPSINLPVLPTITSLTNTQYFNTNNISTQSTHQNDWTGDNNWASHSDWLDPTKFLIINGINLTKKFDDDDNDSNQNT
jgi:hypothetical protein